MIAARLFADVERVLCIGAHSDDIEIGCGGTMLQLRRRYPRIDVRWVVMSATSERRGEAEESAARMLGDGGRVTVHDFRDGYLPFDDPAAVKAALVDHAATFAPDVVFAPRPRDAHQDHRLIGRLAWQVYRAEPVLHYEIPKYEGDLGGAHVYVALDAGDVDAKIDHLLATFPSQRGEPWFEAELFKGLMRMRGGECLAGSGYAEAFEAPKLLLS